MIKKLYLTVVSIMLFNYCFSNEKNIAILNFQAKNTKIEYASIIQDKISSEFVSIGEYKVIERNKINNILQEQEFQLTGITDTKNAVQIGKLLNAQYLLDGSLSQLDEIYFLIINIINVETGEIEKSRNIAANKLSELTLLTRSVPISLDKTKLKNNKDIIDFEQRIIFGIMENSTIDEIIEILGKPIQKQTLKLLERHDPDYYGQCVMIRFNNNIEIGYSFTQKKVIRIIFPAPYNGVILSEEKINGYESLNVLKQKFGEPNYERRSGKSEYIYYFYEKENYKIAFKIKIDNEYPDGITYYFDKEF